MGIGVYYMSWHGKTGMETVLAEKVMDFLKKSPSVRKRQSIRVFERIAYISPENIRVVNYLRKKPIAAFNPGAVLEGEKLLIFPRLIFDYYWYISSIGVFELDMRELLEPRGELDGEFKTRIVIWTSEPWELVGCEDPRVVKYNEKYHVLYTARAITDMDGNYKPLQGYAVLDRDYKVLSKKYFRIIHRGMEFVPEAWKDSAFLEFKGNHVSMLTRPSILLNIGSYRIGPIEVIWWGVADIENATMELETLRPVVPLEKWELKMGLSTNALKIGSNEYLVGWHSVTEDFIYRNGLAVFDNDGNLLGITNYLLEPDGLVEAYGDRPGVIFGNGLIQYKEYVYWIGGISDYAIGIFRARLDKILENMKWLKG